MVLFGRTTRAFLMMVSKSLSIRDIPWLLAFLGVTALKSLPASAIGAQFGATAYVFKWIGGKSAEAVGHHMIMKQVERVVPD